jgi:thiol-disulfide isomerase/thioredoxin
MHFCALAITAALTLGQTAKPVTLVAEVRAALAAHDVAAADAIVAKRRAEQGNSSEVIEASSWLGRGALAERQYDRADRYAAEAQRLAIAALGTRRVDDDARLATAIGAGIEVRAQAAAARGARSDAIAFLERELGTYRNTSLLKRIQKNINLLTLEGRPAPALDRSEFIGPPLPTAQELKGKVVLLFFWAHWCPDCKNMSPALAALVAKYRANGLVIVAPTQRYGYVAGGAAAPPDQELRYITDVRDKYYGFLANASVPVSVANHERFGVSTTPTLVIIDRQGIVRLYHPGQMTEDELDAQLRPLISASGTAAQ